ncbi:UNVERIFIED_CONTAM: hypothetical protein FKN15_071427 [Acipenser sinensis]
MGLQVLLCVLALQVIRTLGCPAGCRCYSLTVECGSIGLREIPADVPPTTQTIFLQDNSIGQIRQQDLSRLGQLHYLYLQNNSISALEPGAFHSQQQLLELALNGNRIHLVSGDVFQGLEHLRILYLAGNQITRLHDFTFRGLQRLQELHLQENSVEQLGEQALAGLSSLALLDLSRNNLRTLSQASLRPLASLQVLRVTVNPWRCDCVNAPLLFSLWHPYMPVDISQEPLYDLDSMDFNALSMATQTTIAIGISMLALTALLLIAMIYSRHRHRKKGPKEENILYVNDYSDGPTTFAQLEEYRDERGHEMYVLNRSKPVFPASYSGQQGELTPEQLQDQATQTVVPGLGERSGEEGERGEEALFINQSLLFDTHIAYEIHC